MNYNPLVHRCYFCEGKDFTDFAKATYWKEYELNFVKCKNCGLIFANPMPGLEAIFEGNRALNILHSSRGTLSQYRGGKEFTIQLIKFKSKGILLDVGSAEGFFLKGIEDNSQWKAEGVEIIESAVKFSKEILNLNVHLGTLDTLTGCEEKYDFIRMNNVIEHIQNPIQFIKKSYNILKQSGKIYCTTPNGVQDGAVLKTANKKGFKLNLLENHFFYYPPKTLKKMFEHCGFDVKKIFSEDISHTINDFGFSYRFKYSKTNQKQSLSDYAEKTNSDFKIEEKEINEFKDHPSLRNWKLQINHYKKSLFRFRFPPSFPIGHQQHLYAEKK